MPVYQVGDLVNPADDWGDEENPDAIGIIIEMRAINAMQPEARILWNDVPGRPAWGFLSGVKPLKRQACNPPAGVV